MYIELLNIVFQWLRREILDKIDTVSIYLK